MSDRHSSGAPQEKSDQLTIHGITFDVDRGISGARL
jgi:hypothetical protein